MPCGRCQGSFLQSSPYIAPFLLGFAQFRTQAAPVSPWQAIDVGLECLNGLRDHGLRDRQARHTALELADLGQEALLIGFDVESQFPEPSLEAIGDVTAIAGHNGLPRRWR